jgi:lysophospholipase L1-like esterase
VQFIGRFDTTDAVGPRTAWPGARIVARFAATDVDVKLTQTDGFSGGPTYFNIIREGAFAGTFSVAGTQTVRIASGLAGGSTHTIEIEKRTEAPFGTVRFEGFTFTGGAGLLAPPVRLPRKLEFLGDSTIDGYGIDGSRTAAPGAPNYCGADLAPPNLNDVRKSVAWKTANGLGAELSVLGYSGKGIARNEDGQVLDLFPAIYPRALPDVGASLWNFASFVPDVVVVSLGGSDYSGDPNGTFPANFAAKYADLVANIRTHYGAAPYVFLTV